MDGGYAPNMDGYSSFDSYAVLSGAALSASQERSYTSDLVDSSTTGDDSPAMENDPLKLFSRLSTSSGSRGRSWLDRFENAALEATCSKTLNNKLDNLMREFAFVCRLYAEVICVERDLPVSQKTVKPAELGGVAGGEKYIACDILFKFCVDHRFPSGSYLYGGVSPNDEAAKKAAGQERKALQAIQQSQKSGEVRLFCPLFATVDYRGQRLSCQSVIEGISNSTLVMGSKNGGMNVQAGDDEAREVVNDIGKMLNLRPHLVLDRATKTKVELPFAADVEIHRASGRLSIVDSARLFPPCAPLDRDPRVIFYQLFRPEFLHWYSEPLSSDAFSSFTAPEDQLEENRRVVQATKVLSERVVEVAKQLAAETSACSDISLTQFLQRHGVNVRYLGRVHDLCVGEKLKEELMREMIARCGAKQLQRHWSQHTEASNQLYLRIGVAHINSLLLVDEPRWLALELWQRFRVSVPPKETASLRDKRLVLRVCQLAGVELLQYSQDSQVTPMDIQLVARVKELALSQVARAEALRMESKERPPFSARRVSLLRLARDILQGSNARDPRVRAILCRTVANLSKHDQENENRWLEEMRGVCDSIRDVEMRSLMNAKLHRLRFLKLVRNNNFDAVEEHLKFCSDVRALSNVEHRAIVSDKQMDKMQRRVQEDCIFLVEQAFHRPNKAMHALKGCASVIEDHANRSKDPKFLLLLLHLELDISSFVGPLSFSSSQVCSVLDEPTAELLCVLPSWRDLHELQLPNSVLSTEKHLQQLLSPGLITFKGSFMSMALSSSVRWPLSLQSMCLREAMLRPSFWRSLPPSLVSLDVKHCFLEADVLPTQFLWPATLRSLVVSFAVSELLVSSLSDSLEALECASVHDVAWTLLPRSLRHIRVSVGGSAFLPRVGPSLLSFDVPSSPLNVLRHVVQSCPSLEFLSLRTSTIADSDLGDILAQCRNLSGLDCSFTPHVTAASLKRLAKPLQQLKALSAYGIRLNELDVGCLQMLAVPLVVAPQMDLRNLTTVILCDLETDYFGVTLAQNFTAVKKLKIVNCNFGCSVLRSILAACADELVSLELANLECKGTLMYKTMPKLRKMFVSNALRESGSRLIDASPALRDLRLRHAFESSHVLRGLCQRKLERLEINSSNADLSDKSGWLARCWTIRVLSLFFCAQLMEDLAVAGFPPNTARLETDVGTINSKLFEQILALSSLRELLLPRGCLSASQLASLAPLSGLLFLSAPGAVLPVSLQRVALVPVPMMPAAPVPGFAFFAQKKKQSGITGNSLSAGLSDTLRQWCNGRKTKWAFCYYWHEEFSFTMIVELLHKGYELLCVAKEHPGISVLGTSPLPREIEESLLKVLVDHCSLHFLEFDGADYSALRASASCFTTHLDLCVLANPLAPSFNVNSVFSKFSSLTDGSAWRQMQDVALNVPALTLAAFHPLIGKNSIVAFLVSPMASSSSVSSNTGGFHLVRAAFAGVGALIQTLALDFPDSLVFGVYPGSILPGRQLAGLTSDGRAVFQNFFNTMFRADKTHHGKLLRFTMDIIPF